MRSCWSSERLSRKCIQKKKFARNGTHTDIDPCWILPGEESVYKQHLNGTGHVDFGIKWQILPLCLKGKFYANHAFVHKAKILHQGCRCVHNRSILRH